MKVEQIYTNCLAAAAYYIESNGEAAIIDPLRETDPYLEKADIGKVKIKYIFETHFHADFVSGHIDLAKKTGAKIIFGPSAKASYEIYEAYDGEEFVLGDVKIKVLHTPGHTLESSTFLLIDSKGKHNAIFTGDTLFIGDVGRPDLAVKEDISKNDLAAMLYDSIRTKIMPLEDSIIVYPAHGAGSACGKNISKDTFSTLGEQKKTNYALQDLTKEEFVRQLTEGILQPPKYFPQNVALNKAGYKSIDDVIRQGVQPVLIKDAEKEIAKGSVLLDTRNHLTFIEGFIPGSINIGLEGPFAIWVGTLIQNINNKIIVVTEKGKEKESVIRLARVGFDNTIGYIDEGIDAWTNQGKSLAIIGSIEPDKLVDRIDQEKLNIIDVRKPNEFLAGHVEIARNLPLDFIYSHLDELNRNSAYYLYCKSGYRSTIASSILKANGFGKVVNVIGGFDAISKTSVRLRQS